MKIELKLLQKELGTTFIYITHDQSEALVMSDKVAVMNQGRFEQIDTPRNLYKNPKTAFVAGFVGESNRFELSSSSDGVLVSENGWRLQKPNLDFDAKVLYIRPEAFILMPSSDLVDIFRFEVTIATILFDGSNTKVSANVTTSGDEVLISLPQNASFEDIKEGDKVEVGVNYENLKCY
jgi:spermidine/putrescine transport system ATP-binding protein